MKKYVSFLLSLLIICNILPSVSAENTESLSLLKEHTAERHGVVMNVSNGTAVRNNRFCEPHSDALTLITDGDKNTHFDVYGHLDDSPARYVGVEFTLDKVYLLTGTAIYAGFANLPESYRIYASDNPDTLYSAENIIADNILCDNSYAPAETSLPSIKAKYIAFFCISYNGNQRIREIELFGKENTDTSTETKNNELSVSGNRIVNGSGEALSLRGVNITELSWSVYGDGSTETGNSDAEKSVVQAVEDWGCTLIRLAVNPTYYLYGGTSGGVTRTAAQYRALVDRMVAYITEEKKIPLILDCHEYYGINVTAENFWRTASEIYDKNELVMYGLLNEPVSSWEILFEGGTLPSGEVKGLSDIIKAIRAQSDNIIVIGGTDWAFDLSMFCDKAFLSFAQERAAALGISADSYCANYGLTDSLRGRGFALDTHIYSDKPMNWDEYIAEAAKEYPVIAGEFGPAFLEDGEITELTVQEKAYLNKIYSFIEQHCAGFTAWGMNAWPYLTSTKNSGTVTAWGRSLKNFIADESYREEAEDNLLYTQFSSCHPIASDSPDSQIYSSDMFYKQAHSNGEAVGSKIAAHIIDGDSKTHFDIYEWENHLMGMEYTLNRAYAAAELTLASGFDGMPDRYIIYASDKKETLYSDESRVEALSSDFTGAVSFPLNRHVKYIAVLARGYVRIKELSLSGSIPGDANGDRRLDSHDLINLRKFLLYSMKEYSAVYDANGNGSIDIIDLIWLKKAIAA